MYCRSATDDDSFSPFSSNVFRWVNTNYIFPYMIFFSAALLDWKQCLRAEWNWNVLYIMFTMRLTWIDLLLNGSRANISRGIECPQVCVNWFPTFVFEKICAKKIFIAIFLNSKIFAIFFTDQSISCKGVLHQDVPKLIQKDKPRCMISTDFPFDDLKTSRFNISCHALMILENITLSNAATYTCRARIAFTPMTKKSKVDRNRRKIADPVNE